MNYARYLAVAALIGGIAVAGGIAPEQEETFRWPNGARAAVCLTYDDCINGDLDKIAPDLEAAKLHATFFVIGSSPPLYKRMDEWRALVQRGHERSEATPCSTPARRLLMATKCAPCPRSARSTTIPSLG